MQPQRLLGIVLLVAGIILLILGIRAADSFSSQFSKFFTGSPTDRAIWMTLGGGAAIVIGAAMSVLPARGAAS